MCIDPMKILDTHSSAAQASFLAQVARNQQQMRERQAGLFEAEARRAEQQGSAEVDRRRLRTAQSLGTARASLAAQGGDIGIGSAPDLLGDVARAGEWEALTARGDAAHRAWRARLQAADAYNEAGLAGASAGNYDRNAQEAWTALGVGTAKSLLSEASRSFASGKWL
jgi:hypothetical protein